MQWITYITNHMVVVFGLALVAGLLLLVGDIAFEAGEQKEAARQRLNGDER